MTIPYRVHNSGSCRSKKIILRCLFVPWLSLKVAYCIQFKVFYILWKKNIAVVNYSQNKSNKLLTFFTLPDKWGTMAILHIRKKSKIKLFFLYAYLLINANSQICGAKFFLFGLPMPIFLFLKLGDISDSGLSTKRKKDVMLEFVFFTM